MNLKSEKLRLLQEKKIMTESLPHLYGFPFYKWSREFFESTNKMNLLVAANQISKSSTAIRKNIHWATNQLLWPRLWRGRPHSFWYLYPNKEMTDEEVTKKWEPEFLPRLSYKDHPIFGWSYQKRQGNIRAIHFNSGVTIFFKSYGQESEALQAGSPSMITCDEELPWHLWPELSKRLLATDGYFNMVFTATLGQEEWREAMEVRGAKERFPTAYKRQVSLLECKNYEDGTPSPWTEERINRAINGCQSQAEVDQRIHGKFVKVEGLKYSSFDATKNLVEPYPIPNWHIYVGADIGSGGETGHPAAICFVAVRPDFKKLAVFKVWRGDGEITTAGDVLEMAMRLRGSMRPVLQCYDYHSKDFYTIASRAGEAWVPAEKHRDIGEKIINTLFKNEMLDIFDLPESRPLVLELRTLDEKTDKRAAKDDAIDAMRYAITRIPIDWSGITDEFIVGEQKKMVEGKGPNEKELRRKFALNEDDDLTHLDIEGEFEAYNELYEI